MATQSSVDAVQEKARKFQSLTVGDSYKVKGKRPITTKYGKSSILLVTDIKTNTDFDLFTTKLLTNYINSGKDLTGGFVFSVKFDETTNFKSAFISGYEPFCPSPFTLF